MNATWSPVTALALLTFALSACSVLTDTETCASEADCRPGAYCVSEGFCVMHDDYCVGYADCAAGQKCGPESRCVHEDFCQSQQDCTDGQKCGPESLCVPENYCMVDEDCGAAEMCGPESLCVSEDFCLSDADCDAPEFCGPDSLCVPEGYCTSDADCELEELCNTDSLCEDLAPFDCSYRIGSDDPDAIELGFMMTFSGPYAESGIVQRQIVELAVDEINANGGIQSGQWQRELAFIACDDQASVEHTVAATLYLTRLGVPAILGPGFSSLLKEAATQAAIPNGTFLLSPSSTATDIRDLDDDNLVWRVSSSDTEQANTLAYFATWLALEPIHLDTPDTIRVVAVHTDDIYGNGFRTGFEAALNAYQLGFQDVLQSAGISVAFSSVPYVSQAEAEDWSVEIQETITEVNAEAPHILLLVGYDGSADIVDQLKAEPALADLPLLMTDGVSSTALATTYASADETPDHLFGVQPGVRTGAAYEHFLALHATLSASDAGDPPTWTEYTYDGVYLLAYAAAAMDPDEMSGAAFADAFTRFDGPGTAYDVGPEHFITACHDMGEGENIDVRGASGPLDFDLATGEPKSVGILRWTVGFPAPGESGEIVDCGLAMVHEADSAFPTTYWCNAQCVAPPDTNTACPSGYCTEDGTICASGLCTGGDDCKPEAAP